MKKIILALVLLIIGSLFIFGCVNPAVCGNGVCETGENHQTCVTDCPVTPVEYHSVCQNNSCVKVTGAGVSECSIDANCQVQDTVPPTIHIISPINNVSVSNTIFFTVSASDNSHRISNLQLYVDGHVVKSFTDISDGNYDVALNLGQGKHVFSADANDFAGNFATDPVTATVIGPSIFRDSNGKVWYKEIFAGVPGNTYYVERTLSLSNQDWVVVATNIADDNGLFSYQQEAVGSMAFFKAVVLTENKLICLQNPVTGKMDLCHCEPPTSKNKSAIIIKQGGIYDDQNLLIKMNSYLKSVFSDINISPTNNIVEKFNGTTNKDFVDFVHSLYDTKDVAYVTIIGDDLPIFAQSKDGDYNTYYIDQPFLGIGEVRDSTQNPAFSCPEQSISYLVPEFSDTPSEKVNFIGDLLYKYIVFHRNPSTTFNNYKKEILGITYDVNLDNSTIFDNFGFNWQYPVYTTFNTNQQEVQSKLIEKPMITSIVDHGNIDSIMFGLVNGTIWVTRYDWLDFTLSKPYTTILLNTRACETSNVARYYTLKGGSFDKNCCWPQVFLQGGVYTDTSEIGLDLSHSFIGQSVLYNLIETGAPYVYGDLFLHFPNGDVNKIFITGKLLDKQNKVPIPYVPIVITFGDSNNNNLGRYTTDGNGNFVFKNVPQGRVALGVVYPPSGYLPFRNLIDVNGKNNLVVNIELDRNS